MVETLLNRRAKKGWRLVAAPVSAFDQQGRAHLIFERPAREP